MGSYSMVEWDIESLRVNLKSLETEYDTLRGYRDYISRLRQTTAGNWQSPAGTDYQSRMLSEIESLDNILKQLEKHNTALKKVLEDCYQTCEDKVKTSAKNLRSSIT